MDAHRSKNVVRGLAALLAVAMAVPVGLAGTVGAEEATCIEGPPHTGWIMLAHERSDENPISQTLLLSVPSESPVPILRDPPVGDDPFGFPQRSWLNGIDSYVIDLGCVTTSNWRFCVDDEPFDPANDLAIRLFTEPIQDPEYEVAFYDADGRTELDQFNKDDTDAKPQTSTPRAVCQEIPEHSRYAVVYLDEGTVNGVQLQDFLWGPFTTKFRFDMTKA